MFKNIVNYVLRFLDRNGLAKRNYVTEYDDCTRNIVQTIAEDVYMAICDHPKDLSFRVYSLYHHQIKTFERVGFGTHVDLIDEILLKYDKQKPYTSVLEVMLDYIKLEKSQDVVNLKSRAKRFDEAVNDLGYPYFNFPAFTAYPGGLAYFNEWFLDRRPFISKHRNNGTI